MRLTPAQTVNKLLSENRNKRGWYWQRKGTCQPEKCQSACCRIMVTTHKKGKREYHSLMEDANMSKFFFVGDTDDNRKIHVEKSQCPLLSLYGECTVHETKNQPYVCTYFPMIPTDGVYQAVRERCTFTFVKVRSKRKKPLTIITSKIKVGGKKLAT